MVVSIDDSQYCTWHVNMYVWVGHKQVTIVVLLAKLYCKGVHGGISKVGDYFKISGRKGNVSFVVFLLVLELFPLRCIYQFH